MVLEKVKIYLDGTMLRIESDDPDFKTRSIPTGRVEVENQGAGYVFTDVIHETIICSVDSFDDVLDAAGSTYGANQEDVNVALNAFLNFKMGGGGTSDAIYPSGAYVNFLPTYASLATVNFTADIFHGAIVEISETIKIEESYARVNTASTGSGIIGIYKLNQSTGDWERVLEATGLDLTVVGSQFLSYSEITLEKGIYATGFILENATIMNRSNVNAMELVFGRSTMDNATSYINKMEFNYAYDGSLPLIAPSPSIASQGTVIPATYHKIV